MLENYYVRPATVDRIRSSWIGQAVERYVSWLAERRYSWKSVVRRVPILVQFGDFAKDRGAMEWSDLPAHVEPFVERWLKGRMRGRKSKDQRRKFSQCVRTPIQQMLRLAVPGYAGLGRARRPENPFGDCAPGFFDYLRGEKGLRERSILHYSHALRQFASYIQGIGLSDVRHLSAAVVSSFVAEYAPRVAWSSLRNTCGVLRVFLRYLYRERVLLKDLSRAVEHPTAYRLSGVPRSISWEQVRQVLGAVDRRTPAGKRDYAILLLLVTYGLRAREVAALTLDDIDWRNDRLGVPQRKAAHSTAFPLSTVVGEAILDYLKNGRPKTQERRLFFRCVAPCAPIGEAAIAARATHYLRKAGVEVPRPGSHTLRHTCVQRLVDAEFPLKTIGDYIGHRSPASTQIYSKVAIEALREVALGDGEEAL